MSSSNNNKSTSGKSDGPQRPFSYVPPLSSQDDEKSTSSWDLSSLADEMTKTDAAKQEAYDKGRALHKAMYQSKVKSWTTTKKDNDKENSNDELLKLLQDCTIVDLKDNDRPIRIANISHRIEDYIRHQAWLYFLNKGGTLLPRSECKYATDEEYLAGACMMFPQDLSRYALGRAAARDAASVAWTSRLVQQLFDCLMQFDFRNGPLRRKFDGVKYVVKNLETLLYELSLTGAHVVVVKPKKKKEEDEPDSKRAKLQDKDRDEKMEDANNDDEEEEEESLVPKQELEEVRKRMVHRDELRETLIKKCRDAQKAAKNAIYALHRGNRKQADRLLEQCETCIRDSLLPITTKEPPLRIGGSFGQVMEEYVECRLFYAWLYGKDGTHDTVPAGDLLSFTDFDWKVETDEYMGGLCDLTGEIGRFAVQRGAERDVNGVKWVHYTNTRIYDALQMLPRAPSGKKMEPVRRSVEKLERMLYELSLSEATGRTIKTDAGEQQDVAMETTNENE